MASRQMMSHRVLRWVVAFGVGLGLALYALQRISDPEPRLQRVREEAVVRAAREILSRYVAPVGELEIVDPLAPDRKVGKSFIYPTDSGWELSGHYRRGEGDAWHPYLIRLDEAAELESLAVRDDHDRLIGLSVTDPRFSAVP
ncbi:MAG: hypothetical protein ACREQZ_06455 [Woeseiaceae bacterium]